MLPWVSSNSTTFNEDFGATVDGDERQAISVFLRDNERVFHTWSTFARGEEQFMLVFDLLDLTPYGRQETWEDSPEGWPQQPPYGGCGCTTRTDGTLRTLPPRARRDA